MRPPPCRNWHCLRPREASDSQRDRDMHEGNSMGIITTFKKPTLESPGGLGEMRVRGRGFPRHRGATGRARRTGGGRRGQSAGWGIGQAVTRALPCIQTKGHRDPGSSWTPIPACCSPRIGTDSSRVHMRFSVQLYRAAQSRSTQWCAVVECSRYDRMVAYRSYTLVSTEI